MKSNRGRKIFSPPQRQLPVFDLQAYIAWNRKQETATLEEVELSQRTESIGDLDLEWSDYFMLPKKSLAAKKIKNLLDKVGL